MKIDSELLKYYINTLFKFDNDLITKKTILRMITLVEEYNKWSGDWQEVTNNDV